MPITTSPEPCWRLVDAAGKDYPLDPGPSHYDSKTEAESAGDSYWSDLPLTARPFDQPCVAVTCDGCGADPEDDEFAHIHFPDVATARSALDWYDYVEAGGKVWCDDCKTSPHEHVGPDAFCGRCGGFDSDHDYALPVHR